MASGKIEPPPEASPQNQGDRITSNTPTAPNTHTAPGSSVVPGDDGQAMSAIQSDIYHSRVAPIPDIPALAAGNITPPEDYPMSDGPPIPDGCGVPRSNKELENAKMEVDEVGIWEIPFNPTVSKHSHGTSISCCAGVETTYTLNADISGITSAIATELGILKYSRNFS
ncbi:hypothetical protein ANO14919_013230 [Xylariales sp. No.14919]|nr:hypothetical protein ANO14919_013230 [Xylariales sp. No.14919]